MSDGLVAVFLEIVTLSWRAAWLIVLLIILRGLLRRHLAPGMVFAAWLVVAVSLLIPLRVPVPWNLLGADKVGETTPNSAEIVDVDAPSVWAPGFVRSDRIAPLDEETKARMAREIVNFDVLDVPVSTTRSYVATVAKVWLMGVVALVLARAVVWFRLQRELRRTSRTADVPILRVVSESCAALGIARMPDVVTTSLVTTPALCGVLRSRLLFPVGFADRLSEEDLRWVVWHELGHLRRRDLLAQSLIQLACVVHWFNPLVWIAVRLARHDCELACDAFVLRRSRADHGEDYGRVLLQVLGRLPERSRLPATVGILEGRRQLLKRIASIADYRKDSLRPLLLGAILLAGFILVSGTAAEKTPGLATTPMKDVMNNTSTETHRELQIEVRAVGEVGDVPVALVDIAGEPSIMMNGSTVLGHRVDSINVARGEVMFSRHNQNDLVLAVTNPRPVVFPVMNEEWIQHLLNSPDYLHHDSAWQQRLPGAVVGAWKQINREAKEKILLNYLAGGYVMSYYILPSGGIHGSPRRLFEGKIRQEFMRRRDDFLASLTLDQRAAYGDGRLGLIRITATKAEQEAQYAAAKELEARQEAVIANLTPEQRALYEAWRNFQSKPSER